MVITNRDATFQGFNITNTAKKLSSTASSNRRIQPGRAAPIDQIGCLLVRLQQIKPCAAQNVTMISPRENETVIIIAAISARGDRHLAQIADAIDRFGFFFGLGECWQKERRQNRDDRDDHEQCDQSETISANVFHGGIRFNGGNAKNSRGPERQRERRLRPGPRDRSPDRDEKLASDVRELPQLPRRATVHQSARRRRRAQ